MQKVSWRAKENSQKKKKMTNKYRRKFSLSLAIRKMKNKTLL